MARYVAFLRAINVAGRYIKMADLAEHFGGLGHSGVQTFINSGNVMFESRVPTRRNAADALATTLDAGLAPLLGFETHTFVRSATRVHDIARRAAALHARVRDGGDVNVAFLGAALQPEQIAALLDLKSEQDDFEFDEREIYWWSQLPQSQSKVSNVTIERKLKSRTTLRRARMLTALSSAIEQ